MLLAAVQHVNFRRGEIRALRLLLLFSHEVMATMQSVVTGQAPITLECKIISGGKQIKTEDNTHNN